MSRRSVPEIEPTDLRDDLATEERVERIWSRLEQEVAAARPRPQARAPRALALALAATFAAFGAGMFAGRAVWSEPPASPTAVAPALDRSTVDVFAAGSQERTYALPGGGSITLAPGSMIEMERSGGSDVRLRLLSGEASLDTASQRSATIASGEAEVATEPGSVVRVRQRADNLDVRVVGGAARVSSPAGTRALHKGDAMDGVPTRTTSAVVTPPVVRVASAHSTSRPSVSDAPAAQVAAAPTWREHYAANRFDEALAELKKQPGGISGAVQSAKTASELYAISDVARSKGGDQNAAMEALRRVADEFGSTQYGSIAARQLSKYYEGAGQADLAKKYRDQAQNGVFGEDALCDQMRAEHRAGHKDEAAARATEYLGKYPNGRCKDEAQSIQAGDAAEDADPPAPGEPAPAAPAPSPTVSASATKPAP